MDVKYFLNQNQCKATEDDISALFYSTESLTTTLGYSCGTKSSNNFNCQNKLPAQDTFPIRSVNIDPETFSIQLTSDDDNNYAADKDRSKTFVKRINCNSRILACRHNSAPTLKRRSIFKQNSSDNEVLLNVDINIDDGHRSKSVPFDKCMLTENGNRSGKIINNRIVQIEDFTNIKYNLDQNSNNFIGSNAGVIVGETISLNTNLNNSLIPETPNNLTICPNEHMRLFNLKINKDSGCEEYGHKICPMCHICHACQIYTKRKDICNAINASFTLALIGFCFLVIFTGVAGSCWIYLTILSSKICGINENLYSIWYSIYAVNILMVLITMGILMAIANSTEVKGCLSMRHNIVLGQTCAISIICFIIVEIGFWVLVLCNIVYIVIHNYVENGKVTAFCAVTLLKYNSLAIQPNPSTMSPLIFDLVIVCLFSIIIVLFGLLCILIACSMNYQRMRSAIAVKAAEVIACNYRLMELAVG